MKAISFAIFLTIMLFSSISLSKVDAQYDISPLMQTCNSEYYKYYIPCMNACLKHGDEIANSCLGFCSLKSKRIFYKCLSNK